MTDHGPRSGAGGIWQSILWPFVLACATYLPVLGLGLVYDDPGVVEVVQRASSAGDVMSAGRSLHYLLLYLETGLHGGSSIGYHLTSLLVHAVATALAALVARRLTGDSTIALICGCLFAVHPVHVEVVASVANRKDALAAVLVFMAVLARTDRRMPCIGYFASWLLFGAALMAKEVAAIGAFGVLFLVDLLHGDGLSRAERLRRAIVRSLPFAAAGFLAVLHAFDYSGEHLFRVFSPSAISSTTDGFVRDYPQTLLTLLASLPEHARLLCAPFSLSADYPVNVPANLFEARPLAGLLTLAVWGVATWRSFRSIRGAYPWIWIGVMLLPCTNIVPLSKFFVAERYLYGPSFGICLIVAAALARLLVATRKHPVGLRRTLLVGVLVVHGAAAAKCIDYVRCWQSEESLMKAALASIPEGTVRVHLSLAQIRARSGDHLEAARHYARVQMIHGSWLIFERLIHELARAGQLAKIEHVVQSLLAEPSSDARPRFHAGCVFHHLDQRDEARRNLQEYLRLSPNGENAAAAASLLQSLGR